MNKTTQNYMQNMNSTLSKKLSKTLVKNSTLFVECLILVTFMLLIPAANLKMDTSGVSFTMSGSDEHKNYLEFVKSFGTDDYILLAIKNGLNISDPELKQRVNRVHRKLMNTGSVLKVIDLETIELSHLFKVIGTPDFWTEKTFTRLRTILPGMNRLISRDMQTLAFIVQIDNEKLNGFKLNKQLTTMKKILADVFPEYPTCYSAGIPVLRSAFERYNLINAIIFGSLGLIFGTLIAYYIFKTLWAGLLVMLTSIASLIWALGIMGIFHIDLNLATGLSFGFILVVSATTVFHIASTYFKLLRNFKENSALIKTFEIILYPCFMCALTTAAGFISLTISPVPMVRQAGVIISVGVLLAFFLALFITAFCLPRFVGSNQTILLKIKGDFLEQLTKGYAMAGFQKSGTCVLAGMLFIIIMVLGIPKIQVVKHLTNPVIKSTPEAVDLAFIEKHISTGTSFSIILQSKDNSFDSKKFWYDLLTFESDLKSFPGVQDVESLTPLIFRTALKFSSVGIMPELIFHQIMAHCNENDIMRAYLDPGSKKLRLVVHIQSQTSDQIETILKQVRGQAEKTFGNTAKISLEGQLLLLRSQTTDLVSSQLETLALALLVITLLMMVQLKSIVLGILSLIPNVFPLAAIFGIMGWFHIPLDPFTIFAAVISFGLSVDDSIHYLTQLKREMMASTARQDIHECLLNAYSKTSRPLISTTAVLFLSSLGLLFSSFSHVFSLGVLIASASIIALLGDLIFMPGFILTLNPLKKILLYDMGRTNHK